MPPQVSTTFETFMKQAPGYFGPWMEAVQKQAQASALDDKTRELAYLAVLSAVRMESGVPFHVTMARKAGATRDEVLSAVLVGLPAVGLQCVGAIGPALAAYDEA